MDKEFEKLSLVLKYQDDTSLHPSKVDTSLKYITDMNIGEWRDLHTLYDDLLVRETSGETMAKMIISSGIM